MKPGAPSLKSTRLLDQVRERVRYKHYSLKTEKAYLYWIRFFIRWSAMQSGGMRHPCMMGVADVEAFLAMAPQHWATAADQTHSVGADQGRSGYFRHRNCLLIRAAA
jgi:hypothetical protein